jgi:hypothetical protein
MATSLPYLPSYKNVEKLLTSIASAKVPETFTQTFLAQTLGLKASSDRPLIPLLRTLGFIDASGRPTAQYRELKNPSKAKSAIADAVRKAYKPLFEANEATNALSSEQLRGLIAQVAGTDEEMTKRISYTFTALAKHGEFSSVGGREKIDEEEEEEEEDSEDAPASKIKLQRHGGLRTDFHYNLQIHLPANGTEDAYLNIFNALRKVFH